MQVCMDKEVEIFFQPCGHISCCQVRNREKRSYQSDTFTFSFSKDLIKVPLSLSQDFSSGLLDEGEKVSKLQVQDYEEASSIPQ